jgi:RNA polymerase sigma-70 factor (ECF subfamily)
MTRSAHISEEIVQEVFVTVWVKRALIAGAKRPEEYVFAILRNCIYAHFRKLAREFRIKSKLGQQPAERANRIEDILDEKETRIILESVIGRLSPQQKLIYKLAKQEGLSREEIADKLNISPNTVKNHLGMAVEHLRRSFKRGVSAILCIAVWMHV